MTFLAGWFVGRRGRRRDGMGCLLLMAGVFAAVVALGTLVAAPLNWMEARRVRALPQPTVAELMTTEPGREVIVPATLSAETVDGSHGFALLYTEQEVAVAPNDSGTPGPSTRTERSAPLPARSEVVLVDGTQLLVQYAPDVRFLNASNVAERVGSGDEETTVTHVGFLPGQAVTLHGAWEGQGLLTADVIYGGARDDYLGYVQRSPGMILFGGLVCGVLAIALLLMGAVARFFGA